VLRTLPDESVHCCVTSPPYFGLRDYGVAGQIGLEPSPEQYIAELVAVFREVRRVLRKDATLWLNLGDSYAVRNPTGFRPGNEAKNGGASNKNGVGIVSGSKAKDLLMIPARVALALQADGWWLRSDIIWAKPNPMPESVRDRPTSAHEHVFLLAKAERYFFDVDAVAEDAIYAGLTGQDASGFKDAKLFNGKHSDKQRGHERRHAGFNEKWDSMSKKQQCSTTRNIRNVWTIATSPFPDAHFATFSPELAERCIKAGTSEKGCCSTCGVPWVRQIEKTTTFRGGSGKAGRTAEDANAHGKWAGKQYGANIKLGPSISVETIGWRAACSCNAPVQPCTVLDPFGGAGTVGVVASQQDRNAILIELSEKYCAMMRKRIDTKMPVWASINQETPS
jgi:DNA modification methylase